MTNAASRNPRTPSARAAPSVRRLRVEHETRYDHVEDVELAQHLAHLPAVLDHPGSATVKDAGVFPGRPDDLPA